MFVPIPNSGSIHVSALSRRQILTASLAVMAASACTRTRSTKVPKILFVCQSGTVKSAVAREIMRRRAAQRGISVEVISRGLILEDHVSHGLREKLAADGINPGADPAQKLSEADWRSADVVVIFNPLPAEARPADLRDWTDLPSMNDEYPAARAILDQRIERLLDELSLRFGQGRPRPTPQTASLLQTPPTAAP